MSYWGQVRRLALKETAELARLDSPGRALMTLLVVVIPGAGIYLATASVEAVARVALTVGAIVGLAVAIYVWKLCSIPPRLAKEAADSHAATVSSLQDDNNALSKKLDELSKPKPAPARDPDGVYQFGVKVGTALHGRKQLNAGRVVFEEISANSEFDRNNPFEWQGLELALQSFTGEGWVRMPGVEARSFANATCSVVGRMTTT